MTTAAQSPDHLAAPPAAPLVDRVIARAPRRWFIGSPAWDATLIIGCPLLSLAFVALVCTPRPPGGPLVYAPTTPGWLLIAAALFTFGHVFLTIGRSHLNPRVLSRYRRRILLTPALLFAAMALSSTVLYALTIVGVLWDEWHSVMQTFGFGRIYDSKRGNDPHIGRRLDMGMCFTLEWLPYLVVLTFVAPADFPEATGLDPELAFLHTAGAFAHHLRWPLIAAAAAYTLFYAASYRRLSRQGYRVAPAKLALYASTGAANITMLAFFTMLEAAVMANFYHATMYVGIVWLSEGQSLRGRLALTRFAWGGAATFTLVIAAVAGLAALRLETAEVPILVAFWLMTSLMHFWFDGFIWSVRRQEV